MTDLTTSNGALTVSEADLMAQFNQGVSTTQLTPTLLLLTQGSSKAVEDEVVKSGQIVTHPSLEVIADREEELEFIAVARSTYYDKKEGQTWKGKEYVMAFDNREFDKDGQYSYDKVSDFVLLTVKQIADGKRVPCTFAFKAANEKACQPLLNALDGIPMSKWCTKVFAIASIPKQSKAGKSYYGTRVKYVRDASKEELAFVAPLAEQIVPAIGQQQVQGVIAASKQVAAPQGQRKY